MEELKNQLKEAQEKLESIKPVEKVTESKIEAKNLVTSVDKVSASTSKVKKNKTSEVTTKVSLGKIDKL
jgi:hypothetical protein